MEETTRPEIEMVRRAVVPTLLAAPLSLAIGWVLDGPGAGATALLGVIVVAANFAAHGLSLAFASRVSIGAVHAVALGGVVIRLGVVLVLMLVLRGAPWFSVPAFGLAVVPGTLALLAFEARLATRGLGGILEVPASPAARRAHEAYVAREA